MKVKNKKKLSTRCFSFLVALTMVFGLFASTPALTANAAEKELMTGALGDYYNENYYDSYEEAEAAVQSITESNVAADMADNYLSDEGEVVEIPTYSDPQLAADYMRKCFVERRSSVKFVYKVNYYGANATFNKIVDYVFKETPNANEGDYLYWNFAGYRGNYSGYRTGSTVTYTITPKYLSTASQEAKIENKVNSLLNGKFDGWEKRTDANNAKRVYNWILANFEYDHASYGEDHSAYGGFINGETVCQGYASASYMLLKKMGITNRVVASDTHGWNIVKIKGKYYNFDTTWGDDLEKLAPDYKYFYFLCDEEAIVALDEDGEHTRVDEWASSSFNSKYPMASDSYVYKDSDNATFGVKTVGVTYRTHVQSYGWENPWKKSGKTSGTIGQAKRLEAIQLKLSNTSGLDLGIEYKTHIQSYGWESSWKRNGATSGTSGQGKRLEAIKIRLTGADAARYDVYYRVHAQSYGWLGWAKNGEEAGTAGQGKRLEGIQVVVVKKGQKPSGTIGYSYVEYGKTAEENYVRTGLVNYRTHVQSYGWQGYVKDGSLSGTYGEGKRLEAIQISLGNTGYSGNIQYRTHVQSHGWMAWKSNGAMSGTSGEGKRLEAIQIKLTGTLAKKYDVYYRVHAQSYGWLGWAKNGQSAGTEGLGKRLESIQIVLVRKGKGAPSASTMPACVK